jgi:RNA ligase
MPTLLTRDEFREAVFERDRQTCVVPGCGYQQDPEAGHEVQCDAHHIIERRLWSAAGQEGGYFIENGATLCPFHHLWGAETCAIQPDVLRYWAKVDETVLPSGWDPDHHYDKWGTALRQPTRHRIKYPSTPYLPMSPGVDPEDTTLPDLKPFLHQPLAITIKMDGGNTLLTRDLVAARNGHSADHASFDWLKALHPQFRDRIPEGIEIFGENLYARHSIHYVGKLALASHFMVFAIYDQQRQVFGSWPHVEMAAKLIGFPTVPVVEYGRDYGNEHELEGRLRKMARDVIARGHEGLVVRTGYPYVYAMHEGYGTRNSNDSSEWNVNAIGKYVRENHVSSEERWDEMPIVKNEVLVGKAFSP